MVVKTYIENLNKPVNITFIKARARKDANTPFYHPEYQTTSLFSRIECEEENYLSDWIILNDKTRPLDWLCGASWDNSYTICLLVIHPDDLALLYPNEKQRKSMIDYIDKRIQF